jgi:hypothetical protein
MVTVKSNAFYFLILLLIPLILFGADPKIDAEIDTNQPLQQGFPIKGTLSVTHDLNQKVDGSSFQLGNQPLKADFVQDVRISPNDPLVISMYTFMLPATPAGLQILPSISVKVGGKVFKSISSTFEVKGGGEVPQNAQSTVPTLSTQPSIQPPTPVAKPTTPTQPASTPSSAPAPIKLKLDAFVDGTQPMYPGQYVRLVYRFFFEGLIDLSKEQLPMIDTIPSGLNKIGDPEIKEGNQGQESIREFSQVVQGGTPGTYKFGGAFIEGFAYQLDASGNKVYDKTPLRSETPSILVEVVPFPIINQPASFEGAVGEFNFTTLLASSPQVSVGEKLNLILKVSGKEGLKDVILPDLCCQPGVSGLFKLGDLPSAGQVKGTSKVFTVELRPLSENVKEVPSIEFSYFNPSSKSYVILNSKSIPLIITSSQTIAKPSEEIAQADKKQKIDEGFPKVPEHLEPIELSGVFPISYYNLPNWFFKTWWVLLLIPIGSLLLLLQIKLRNFLILQNGMKKLMNSHDLFQKFLETKDTSSYFHFLNQAFLTKLLERHEISSTEISLQKIPKNGFAGEVRAFLCWLEEARFLYDKTDLSKKKITQKAKLLFDKGESK